MITYTTYRAPFGELGLAKSERGLCAILFPEAAPFEQALLKQFSGESITASDTDFEKIKQQLDEYFAGQRKVFDFKLDIRGSSFQTRVLETVVKIPYGAVANYGDIANKLGKPTASRAVGGANARNPLPIVIPCHRVIGANGNLIGYGGGIERKQYLLDLEAGNLWD